MYRVELKYTYILFKPAEKGVYSRGNYLWNYGVRREGIIWNYCGIIWNYCGIMWNYLPKWNYGVHNFGQMFTPRIAHNIVCLECTDMHLFPTAHECYGVL